MKMVHRVLCVVILLLAIAGGAWANTTVVNPAWSRSSGFVSGVLDQPWTLPPDPNKPWVTGALALPTDLTSQAQVWDSIISQAPVPLGHLWASWNFPEWTNPPAGPCRNVRTFHFKGTFTVSAADIAAGITSVRLFDPFKAGGIIPINDAMYVFLNGTFVTLTGAQILDNNVAPETSWYRPSLYLPPQSPGSRFQSD